MARACTTGGAAVDRAGLPDPLDPHGIRSQTPGAVKNAHLAAFVLASLAGCNNAPPEPQPDPSRAPVEAQNNGDRAGGGEGETRQKPGGDRPTPPMPPPKRKVSAKPTAQVKASADDPVKGKWTL